MDVSRRFIQVTGTLEIGESLEMGQDVDVTVSVVTVTDKDNQDGTVDRYYKAKLFVTKE